MILFVIFVSVFVWRRRLAKKRQKKWEYDDVFTKINETEDKTNIYEDMNYEEIELNSSNSSPEYLIIENDLETKSLDPTLDRIAKESNEKIDSPSDQGRELMDTQTASTSISAPKPLPRRGDPKMNEMKLARENIYHLLIVLKKAINSPKITDSDRNQRKTTMDSIDTKLSSSDTSLKIEDLNNFAKQLEEFKQKLN